MIKKAMTTIQRFHLLSSGDTVLTALSGGADSIALASFLFSIKEQYNLALEAAHVNHGLRGEESERDEAFVRAFCAKRGIPLHVLRADVKKEAIEQGEGLEACGRRLRYAYFDALSAGRPFMKIATAHTLSDSVETLMLHLARGTGLAGAGGIAPRRGQIIRPLIHCTREEVEAYCAANALEYVTDSTNADLAFARNRVRHAVLPELRRVNSALEQNVGRFMETVRMEDAFLERMAQERLDEISLSDGSLNAGALLQCEEALRRRALRIFVHRGTGFVPELHHIDRMEQCLKTGTAGEICGGYRVRAYRNRFFLFKPKNEEGKTCNKGHFIDGNMNRLVLSYEDFINIEEKRKNEFAFWADYDKIIGNVILRARQPGDALIPAGGTMRKTLKKLFQEKGIPKEKREELPVVCDDEGVLGIWGVCTARRAALSKATQRVYVLTK